MRISLIFGHNYAKRICRLLYHVIVSGHLRKDINSILEAKINDGHLILTLEVMRKGTRINKNFPDFIHVHIDS